jgi:hypothetical protein
VRPAWDTKRRVISVSPDLHLWANSDWALAKVREAVGPMLAGRPTPRTIRFGVELEVFKPRDRAACREALDLPADTFIVMSSASSLADPRKGLGHLAEAMRLLNLEDALVAGVGWFNGGEKPPIPGMRAMGYMDDPKRLAMLYSAADVFVGPSLEEAFGQVFIEAAACGTPSIGYPVGGKPEAILHGVSGLLTDEAAPASLAEAIETLYLDRDLRESMGRWARVWAESCWSMSASAHRLFSVLRAQGLAARLGLGPKLNLSVEPKAPPEPVLVDAKAPGWRALSGFDYWEGPYPEKGLPRCRWAHGPVAKFEVASSAAGPGRLLISGRTFDPGQRVRLVQDGRAVGELGVPPSHGANVDHVLSFDVELRRGHNPFELHFWRWQTAGHRPLALLVSSITVLPDAPRPATGPSANGHGRAVTLVEAKPAAPAPR